MKIVPFFLATLLPILTLASTRGELESDDILQRQLKTGGGGMPKSSKHANSAKSKPKMAMRSKMGSNNGMKSKMMNSKRKKHVMKRKKHMMKMKSKSSKPPTCKPTTGPCVETYAELLDVVASAKSHDVIALCGCGTPIEVESAVTITESHTTLCCTGKDECIMQSSGSDRNLLITGESATLEGITFRSGAITESDGGNVAIIANGTHHITDCKFIDGSITGFGYGGNIIIDTVDSVTVQGSSFLNGNSNGGGGLAVLNAAKISVDDSVFQRNTGSSDGGGLFLPVVDYPTGQEISVTNSKFLNNKGGFGGGLLATVFGTFPRLLAFQIENCEFKKNTAEFDGGAGATFFYTKLENMDISLKDNFGSGNVALDDGDEVCDNFSLFFESSGQCIAVDEDFP